MRDKAANYSGYKILREKKKENKTAKQLKRTVQV